MSLEPADALLLLELDKGSEDPGPLFQEPKRRLEEDASFRAEWMRYQALKALALEAAASLTPRLLKEAQRACRRANLADSLAQSTGDDAARTILLAQETPHAGARSWKPALFLAAAAALAWLAWKAPRLAQAPAPAPPQEDLAFEFSLMTPTPAAPDALSRTAEAEEDAEAAVEAELPAVERRAKKLLIRHLKGAPKKPTLSPTGDLAPIATRTGTPVATASATPSLLPPRPTPSPTTEATSAPSPRPTPRVTPKPTPQPTDLETVVDLGVSVPLTPGPPAPERQAAGGAFDLDLVSPLVQASAGRKARLDLVLPAEGSVDLRVFSAQGAGVRTLADGVFSAGRHRFDWDGRDNKGRPAPVGTYYLRVMTRWSSRVESLEVR